MTVRFSAETRRNVAGLATLWFILGALARVAAAPVFTQQPVDAVVALGQSATFTAAATGAGGLTLQWERNGAPISGATGTTYVIPHITRADEDVYDVVASDSTGSARSNLGRLWAQLPAYAQGVALDRKFDPRLETKEWVSINTLLPTSDGGYFAAGNLTSINGAPRFGIVHMTADGRVDPGFVPPRLNGGVYAVARQPDGKVLIGGQFTQVDGANEAGLIRLNADGSRDSSFDASNVTNQGGVNAVALLPDGRMIVAPFNGPGILYLLAADGSRVADLLPGSFGAVVGLAVQSDGKIIAAGYFQISGNGGVWTNLARFNVDGTLDTSFASHSWQTNLTGVAVGPNDVIYVAGYFTAIDDIAVSGLVRLKSNGNLDQTFAPAVDGHVASMAVTPQGMLVVGGAISSVNGIAVKNIARLTATGRVDDFAASVSWYVQALAVLRDGTIAIGAYAYGYSADVNLALEHFSASGNIIASGFTMRSPGIPYSALALPDGKTLIFGIFDEAGGIPAAAVARLNPDLSIDASFQPAPARDLVLGYVNSALALPDGRIAVAGYGYTIDLVQHCGAVLLLPDGNEDPTFRPPSVVGNCVAIAYLPSGNLIVAGTHPYGGDPAQQQLVALNLDGTRDYGFSIGAGFDGLLRCLVTSADGGVIVGGSFTKYNGASHRSIVRLNADGSADPGFAAAARFTESVGVLAAAPGGKLYAAGQWTSESGEIRSLVRLNADGSLDPTFACPLTDQVGALTVQADGRVIVRAYGDAMYRLNTDGSIDTTFFTSGVDAGNATTPNKVIVRDNGQLLVVDSGRVFATIAAVPPTIVTPPQSQTVVPHGSVTLSADIQSAFRFTYAWYRNGAAIPGATDASVTIADFGPSSVGEYKVVATNQYGSTTASATVTAPLYTKAHLINLSVRTKLSGDGDPLIVGFSLGGEAAAELKPLLLRAVGPTLGSFGVAGALPDPTLQLYDGASHLLDQNDDWRGSFPFGTAGAFPFAGPNPKDAALYSAASALGRQSIIAAAKPGSAGLILAEVYDATKAASFTTFTPRLVNGSARGFAGTGDDALILGFIIGGESSVHILVRAAGPALAGAPFNIPGVLVDPQLEVYGPNGKIAENDNWGDSDTVALRGAFTEVGAFGFAPQSKDAAMILTLAPGLYSAVVRGVGNTTGGALVELYELP